MIKTANRCRLLVMVVLGLGYGCADAPDPTEQSPLPARPLGVVAALRGTVNFTTGTMTFDRIPASAHSRSETATGPSAAMYGNQGVTVRIYNTPVTIINPSSAGKKTYTGNVGVRNLLAHAIGDEQAAAAPPDTMGIYVFFTTNPVVTATSSPCSPACTVTATNNHGTLAFTAPSQKYFHWTDRLGAAGTTTDTTRQRKAWVFQADTQVTTFTFEVLVSSAWAAPNETRWKIDYQADSLPDTQSEPRWTQYRDATGLGVYTYSASDGILNLLPGGTLSALTFYRRDSVAVAANAYIEVRLRYNGIVNDASTPGTVIDDGVKTIAFGVAANTVGFIHSDRSFFPGVYLINTTAAFHVYQLRKYAADSAVFFVDGVRGGSILYSALQPTSFPGTSPLFQFGQISISPLDTSDWDYVVYEIGAVSP